MSNRLYIKRNLGSCKDENYFKHYYVNVVKEKKGITQTRLQYLATRSLKKYERQLSELSVKHKKLNWQIDVIETTIKFLKHKLEIVD